METKFTKGEWHYVEYAGTFLIQNGDCYGDKDLLRYTEIFDDNHVTEQEANANAKLITAAPDLSMRWIVY